MNDSTRKIRCMVVRSDGVCEKKDISLIIEHRLQVWLNGKESVGIVCTKDALAELVVGRLYTQGSINSISSVREISFDPEYKNARVTFDTGDGIAEKAEHHRVITKCDWKQEWIFELADAFSKDTPIHSLTGATHSCMLAKGRDIIATFEDISRHNAVDKAIGYALINDIGLSDCILYSSGRVPLDMMEKVIAAGIRILVSKSVPTVDAVEMAKAHGVVLICKAYPEKIEIYN